MVSSSKVRKDLCKRMGNEEAGSLVWTHQKPHTVELWNIGSHAEAAGSWATLSKNAW